MASNNGFSEKNDCSPNEVNLPRWRIDNIYAFAGAAVIAIVTSTLSIVSVYYNVIITINENASDTKLIKQDIAYIKEMVITNAEVSDKKLDKHIEDTDKKIQELDQIALKVSLLEGKIK